MFRPGCLRARFAWESPYGDAMTDSVSTRRRRSARGGGPSGLAHRPAPIDVPGVCQPSIKDVDRTPHRESELISIVMTFRLFCPAKLWTVSEHAE